MSWLALMDLRHGLLRSIFSSLGMAVLIFAFLLLIALTRTVSQFGDQGGLPQNLIVLEHDVLQPEQSRVDPSLVGQVDDLLGDRAVRVDPVIFRIMRVQEHPIQLRGVAPEAWQTTFRLGLVAGDWPQRPDEVLVGQALADIAGWIPGTEVEIYSRPFQVAGVADGPGTKSQTVWLPFAEASRLFGADKGAQLLVVHLNAAADPVASRQALLDGLRPAGAYDAYFEDALVRQYGSALNDLSSLSYLTAAIAVAAVTLGSHNLAWLAAEERKRLLGVLRALGFDRASVGGFLVTRALVLTTSSYLVALGAATVFLRWGIDAQALLISGAQSSLALTPTMAALGWLLSCLSALVGTWLSATRVLQASPASLLGRGPGGSFA